MILEISFWLILLLLLHTYVLFPLSLPMFAEIFRWRSRRIRESKLSELPTVSIVVSAYNEEAIIAQKIQNCLELDYPAERLQILIGNDGSKDKTAEIVERYAPRVTLVNAPVNAGKAAMLNQLVEQATGDILLLCDANTMFFPNVVRKIVAPFAATEVGCVSGHLILSDESGSALGKGETSYWDLESEIKKFEGQIGVLIGSNGAIYALRRSLYSRLPTRRSVMDDFYVSVKVLMKGYWCTFLSAAVGTEQTSKAGSGEYKRKIRIGRANFNYLHSYLPLLNPLRPLVAYFFISHKLLRWFSPHLVLFAFSLNAYLALHYFGYRISFGLGLLFLILAAVGWQKSLSGGKLGITAVPYYFTAMLTALFQGFLQSFLPEKGGGWARIERGGEA